MSDSTCPFCRRESLPIVEPVSIQRGPNRFYDVRMERYRCWCGWIWATLEQRKRNNKSYKG